MLDLATAHAATLRELRVLYAFRSTLFDGDVAHALALLRAAPALRELHFSMSNCKFADAVTSLSGATPWAPLRLYSLEVTGHHGATNSDVTALAHAVSAQHRLPCLHISFCDHAAVQGNVNLYDLHLFHCPALRAAHVARLLQDSALTKISICGCLQHVGAHDAALLMDALRSCRLISIELGEEAMWRDADICAGSLHWLGTRRFAHSRSMAAHRTIYASMLLLLVLRLVSSWPQTLRH